MRRPLETSNCGDDSFPAKQPAHTHVAALDRSTSERRTIMAALSLLDPIVREVRTKTLVSLAAHHQVRTDWCRELQCTIACVARKMVILYACVFVEGWKFYSRDGERERENGNKYCVRVDVASRRANTLPHSCWAVIENVFIRDPKGRRHP